MRLNPFAFPSETDSRFALLVLAVVGSTTFVYNWLISALPFYRELTIAVARDCDGPAARAATELVRMAANPAADQRAQLAATRTSLDCIAGYQQTVALLSLSGVIVLVVMAAILYVLIPRW